MDLLLPISILPPPARISYGQKIMLTGSCFSEQIGERMASLKFQILQNPHGILFDPCSVAGSLVSYIQQKKYGESDLFRLHEIWHSWDHHGSFSGIRVSEVVEGINLSQQRAHKFLQEADWLLITLGSAFSYRLTEAAREFGHRDYPVANCHRAPAQWFRKHLMGIEEICASLDNMIHQLRIMNPEIRIIFTVSPVRHIRDGVVENNRSKARLIESVHQLVNKFSSAYYFPAYELVVDILRDYRFYDIDLVHPNYQATEFVFEKFADSYIEPASRELMRELGKLLLAKNHRAFQPATQAHRQFLAEQLEKTKQITVKYPFLDLQEELEYFSTPPA
jgi:hypothetical protein